MSEKKFWIIMVLIVLLVITSCVGLGVGYDYTVCQAKTSQIGFPSRYSVFGGCLIEVSPDKWIPLDSYYFKQQ